VIDGEAPSSTLPPQPQPTTATCVRHNYHNEITTTRRKQKWSLEEPLLACTRPQNSPRRPTQLEVTPQGICSVAPAVLQGWVEEGGMSSPLIGARGRAPAQSAGRLRHLKSPAQSKQPVHFGPPTRPWYWHSNRNETFAHVRTRYPNARVITATRALERSAGRAAAAEAADG
jgi:hypothetical protein